MQFSNSREALRAAAALADGAWQGVLDAFISSQAGVRLSEFLDVRAQTGARIFPATERLFQALVQTPLSAVRVVILGQDPYHGEDWVGSNLETKPRSKSQERAPQAQGLAFSVPRGMRPPPSLRNVLKEALGVDGFEAAWAKNRRGLEATPNGHTASTERDLFSAPAQQAAPTNLIQPNSVQPGWLDPWARQGVLLLNTSLSVEQGKPGSHSGKHTGFAWEALTDDVIQAVAMRPQPCVYLLWGAHAQAKRGLIEAAIVKTRAEYRGEGWPSDLGCILVANHPSPLSALRLPQPFMGCGHFADANRFLALHGLPEIDWRSV